VEEANPEDFDSDLQRYHHKIDDSSQNLLEWRRWIGFDFKVYWKIYEDLANGSSRFPVALSSGSTVSLFVVARESN
jgi:hypothetical protein